MPVGVRFSASDQTGPGAHPASYTMGTGSLSREQSGRGMALTTHPPSSTDVKQSIRKVNVQDLQILVSSILNATVRILTYSTLN